MLIVFLIDFESYKDNNKTKVNKLISYLNMQIVILYIKSLKKKEK